MHTVAGLLLALASVWSSAHGTTGTTAGQAPPVTTAAKPHPALAGAGSDAARANCHKDVTTRPVLHGPVATGQCTACHVMTTTGETAAVGLGGGATAEKTSPLCATCHEDMVATLKRAYVHAPVAAGACTVCHDPHGSAFEFQLRARRQDVCFTCHEDVAEMLRQEVPHAPAAASCVVCHEPHGSRFRAETRQGLNTLCLTCHAPRWAAPDLETPAEEEGWRRALAAAGLSGSRRRIGLDVTGDRGHPVYGHPVRGVRDPLHPGLELTCVGCHNPHGAAARGLFRFGATNVSDLCIKCHKL